MNHRAAAVLVLASLPALGAGEELTIVSRTTLNDRAPTTTTQYIGQSRIRSSDGENDTIMDVAGGRFIVVNHQKKEFYEFTDADLKAAMQKFEAQMSGPMAGMMEKMMGGPVGEVKVVKGASRKVAGYDCTDYTLTMGDNMSYQICATQALALPTQYYDALKTRYQMMGPMGRRFGKMYDAMKEIKGFPIAVKAFKVRSSSEATEIKKGPIPASAFEVPAGYKKKDAPFGR
jgi:hypothetical protein